jgi:hypothetical protein
LYALPLRVAPVGDSEVVRDSQSGHTKLPLDARALYLPQKRGLRVRKVQVDQFDTVEF